ncbi:MAG TPA: DUF5915 domain-containing protein, partial [Polyangiaceae bacterium]
KNANPQLEEHLKVHKPYIDAISYDSQFAEGARMRRVPEVIDCWYDSGAMPFAQWGYPQTGREKFREQFPADFISEALDQTRGWFYSQLAIATLLFRDPNSHNADWPQKALPIPFKTCIVLGHVCDREGRKESKSKGNYTPPELILDKVCMDFGVVHATSELAPAPGEALVAREDLEGMDLEDAAEVALFRPDQPAARRTLKIRGHKKVPRRVIVVAESDAAVLTVRPIATGLDTRPQEVPRAPVDQRLSVEDEHTPAPGADAFRWFFYASSPPWSNTRHSLRNVRTLQKDFLIKIRNVYSFFTIYANIDGWRPTEASHAGRPRAERALLDRWLLSELNLATAAVRRSLDAYLSYDAALALIDFAEALSNWYVRRSRSRFWGPGLPPDKCDAYATLHTALVTLSRLLAPFVPFLSEEIYQNLAVFAGAPAAAASVHLDRFPAVDEAAIDQALSLETRAVRDVVSLGLSVRTANKLKVRQPLSRADIVLNDGALLDRLSAYKDLIREELNVHDVRFMFPGHEQGAVAFKIKPNFRALGPRLGKNVQAAKKVLEAADGSALHAELSRSGGITLEIAGEQLTLGPEEIAVTVEAAPGFAAETGRIGVVVLHTTLTEQLIDEGLQRELISRVQAARKDLGLEFTARIVLHIDGSERVLRVARAGEAYLRQECLADSVAFSRHAQAEPIKLGDETLELFVARA